MDCSGDFILLQTVHGNLKPVVMGYQYMQKSKRSEHTIYICTQEKSGCRARIKLSNNDYSLLPHDTRPHNHLPLTRGKVEAMASRQKMTRDIKQQVFKQVSDDKITRTLAGLKGHPYIYASCKSHIFFYL